MNVFGLIDASILWFYGGLILTLTVKNWNHTQKPMRVKYSEIVYAAAFEITGFYLLFNFNGTGIDPTI